MPTCPAFSGIADLGSRLACWDLKFRGRLRRRLVGPCRLSKVATMRVLLIGLVLCAAGCGVPKDVGECPFRGAESLQVVTVDLLQDGGSLVLGVRANHDAFFYLMAEHPMASPQGSKTRRVFWMRSLNSPAHELAAKSAGERELLELLHNKTEIDKDSRLPKEVVPFFAALVADREKPWPKEQEWPKRQ